MLLLCSKKASLPPKLAAKLGSMFLMMLVMESEILKSDGVLDFGFRDYCRQVAWHSYVYPCEETHLLLLCNAMNLGSCLFYQRTLLTRFSFYLFVCLLVFETGFPCNPAGLKFIIEIRLASIS